jgi:aldehyde dehydrogenase (NAD+)
MDRLKFYIDGAWVDPAVPAKLGIVNPATEETFAQISLGSRQDVDRAAKAARRAFATYSETSVEERLAYLHKIIAGFRARLPELARIVHDSGLPAGVFNLVNGDGPTVGEAIAVHPGIDMVSFTGSTTAGIRVAKLAADTVKRVAQELGGKSANIILADADLNAAVTQGVHACYTNGGQNCQSPTRMLIPRAQRDAAFEAARKAVDTIRLGDPLDPASTMGPMVSQTQYGKIQDLIQSGVDEGATLVAGGTGRPANVNRGYYVRPTVFGDVTPNMRIAREEIFGPVLSIISYDTEDEAIEIANDTPFGLAGFVQSKDLKRARAIANRIRAGRVYLNGAPFNRALPFGGYKQSGNGREFGVFGFEEYLEVKGILGYRE